MKFLKHYEKHSDYLNVKDSFSEEKMPMIFRCGNIEHLHFKSLMRPIYKLSGTFFVEEGYEGVPFGLNYRLGYGESWETVNFEYNSVKKFEIDNKIITPDEEGLSFGVVATFVNEGEHTFNIEFSSPLKNLNQLFYQGPCVITTLHMNEDVLSKNAIDVRAAFSNLQIPNENFKIFEKLNTSNVKYMAEMFGGCTSLTSIDLSNWNTSNVTDMSGMFGHCSGLTSLDLSNWNTSKVTTMNNMFIGCTSLTELKMGGNPSSLTNVYSMFTDVTTNGAFYYNSIYNYSRIIAVLPSTWTAVPCTMVDGVLVPNE